MSIGGSVDPQRKSRAAEVLYSNVKGDQLTFFLIFFLFLHSQYKATMGYQGIGSVRHSAQLQKGCVGFENSTPAFSGTLPVCG